MDDKTPTIEKIELVDKEYVKIYLSDGSQCSSHIDVLNTLNLKKGGKVDKNTIEKISSESRRILINKAIYSYITYKPRTKKEIRNKFRSKGYSESEIEEAIEHFAEMGYIDDEKYAFDYFRNLKNKSKYSNTDIKRKLLTKGIPKEIIDRVSNAIYDRQAEYMLALNLAKKKMMLIRSDNKKEIKDKIYRYLVQKKFQMDVIKYVIEDIFIE